MSIRIAQSRTKQITEGTPEEAAEALWEIYYDENFTAKDYNWVIDFTKILRQDWREFIEES